jgi:peptidoglycan hydrolase-like protein with peptidoglycan-binding domain
VFVGCASTSNYREDLETKISNLEERLDTLEKSQGQLQEIVLSQMETQEATAAKINPSEEVQEIKKDIVGSPSNQDIQTALKNAGFYDGEIDGKIGPKTRNAIMEFQKKNNLEVDGIIGQKTWEVLGQFLTQEKQISSQEEEQ